MKDKKNKIPDDSVPAITVAMGLKQNTASALCWKEQVANEQKLREAWQRLYDPEDTADKRSRLALERTIERDRTSREDYSDPQRNPELYTILYRQNLDSATSRFRHHQKTAQDGGAAAAGTQAEGSAQQQQPAHSSRGPVSSAFTAPSTGETTSRAAVANLPPVYRTRPYLEARSRHYAPQERYPQHEPPTSSLVVGWHCKDSLLARSNVDLYKPVRPNVMGPYRNPEDADHAALFGYDLDAK